MTLVFTTNIFDKLQEYYLPIKTALLKMRLKHISKALQNL